MMQKWEYCHIDTFRSPKVARFVDGTSVREETFGAGIEGTMEYIAGLGQQGWEMVGIEVRVESRLAEPGELDPTPVRSQPVYWFKRPRE
jgi:hypothetical protein